MITGTGRSHQRRVSRARMVMRSRAVVAPAMKSLIQVDDYGFFGIFLEFIHVVIHAFVSQDFI